MIQDRTLVKIADNSGGIIGRVFKILGGSKRRYAAGAQMEREEVRGTVLERDYGDLVGLDALCYRLLYQRRYLVPLRERVACGKDFGRTACPPESLQGYVAAG